MSCIVECPETLRVAANLELGVRVNVHRRAPVLRNPCTPVRVSCRHGAPHWMVPSGEQVARWRVGLR